MNPANLKGITEYKNIPDLSNKSASEIIDIIYFTKLNKKNKEISSTINSVKNDNERFNEILHLCYSETLDDIKNNRSINSLKYTSKNQYFLAKIIQCMADFGLLDNPNFTTGNVSSKKRTPIGMGGNGLAYNMADNAVMKVNLSMSNNSIREIIATYILTHHIPGVSTVKLLAVLPCGHVELKDIFQNNYWQITHDYEEISSGLSNYLNEIVKPENMVKYRRYTTQVERPVQTRTTSYDTNHSKWKNVYEYEKKQLDRLHKLKKEIDHYNSELIIQYQNICNGEDDKNGKNFYTLYSKVSGETLDKKLMANSVTLDQMKKYTEQVFRSLAIMQESRFQISHNDLSTENVMIDNSDNAVIIDFGQASFCIPAGDTSVRINHQWNDSSCIRSGVSDLVRFFGIAQVSSRIGNNQEIYEYSYQTVKKITDKIILDGKKLSDIIFIVKENHTVYDINTEYTDIVLEFREDSQNIKILNEWSYAKIYNTIFDSNEFGSSPVVQPDLPQSIGVSDSMEHMVRFLSGHYSSTDYPLLELFAQMIYGINQRDLTPQEDIEIKELIKKGGSPFEFFSGSEPGNSWNYYWR